jgi:toxin CptA
MHAPPSLSLELHSSPRLAVAILGVHLLAAAGLASAHLPTWVVLIGGALLLWSAIHGLRRHALLRAPQSVFRVQARADGSIECLTRDGEWQKLRLQPDSSLFPLFAVLCLKPEGGGRRRTLTIFPDALPVEDWRRLCVWLRWAASGEPIL